MKRKTDLHGWNTITPPNNFDKMQMKEVNQVWCILNNVRLNLFETAKCINSNVWNIKIVLSALHQIVLSDCFALAN